MAKSVKQSASRTVVWIILLLLIVGLAGFGAVSFSGNMRSVGSVGETPIPVHRYARQLTQDLRALQAQFGPSLGFAEAQQFGIDRLALSKVIAQVALEDEAARIGLSAGDEAVRAALLQVPDFQGFDGRFDDAAYREILRRQGIGVGEFEAQLRAELARRRLATGIAAGAAMPETMTEAIYQWAGERRSFLWAELTEAALPEPVPAPTEEDLAAFYEANPERYTEPEKKAITYAWLTPSMLVGKVEVDEEGLRELYESRSAQYNQPERRLVERLVFATADEAQAAWDRLQAGEIAFDDLVTARGLALEDIDLGDVTQEALGAAGPAVFALTEPGLVGPVETDLGPAILRMNGILAAEAVSFEEARDELKDEYATDRARRLIGEMTEQVNDLLASGATLEELVQETDLDLGKIEFHEDAAGDIAGYAAFRAAAEAVTEGDFPEAVGLDDGGIFALRLDQVIPPRLRPIEEVRAQVAADWKAAEIRSRLNALADELIPRIEAGEPPGSFGITVNTETALTRDAFLADVPEGLVAKAFELAPGQAARIDGTPGTPAVAIVSTTEVLPPDPDNADLTAARAQYAERMDDELAGDLLEAMTEAVQARAGISLDAAAINAVNAQFQ